METVKINMVPKGAVKAAHASQGDAPRVVRFELFDEFLPYTLDGSEDITLTVVRPDTEEIVSSVTNTEEAYIDVSFTSEMTALRGVANCEIKITKSGAEIGSHNFDLNIERDAYGEDITVETASGVIATFTTGVIDNLVSLKTTFEPKQDLHGYPSPWIDSNVINKTPYLSRALAGTASRIGNYEFNKLVGGTYAFNQQINISAIVQTKNVNDITFTNNNDGSITINGTASDNIVNENIAGITLPRNNHVSLIAIKATNLLSGLTFGVGGYLINNTRGAILSKTTEATAWTNFIRVNINNGTSFNNYVIYPQNIDLTQMFGSTIADYIYNLETAQAGAGVSFFKSLFGADYYAYNAGELMSVKTSSHNTIGFNQWNEVWELGGINYSTGQNQNENNCIRSKDYIPVIPSARYYFKAPTTWSASSIRGRCYDKDKNYIQALTITTNTAFNMPNNCYFFRFSTPSGATVTTYNNDICINLSDLSRNGEYEPYVIHSYALDPDIELRGIPKLDENNNLYYDGDTYESNGDVTRRYGIVDLGSLTWNYSTAANNIYLFHAFVPNIVNKPQASAIIKAITNNPKVIIGFQSAWTTTLYQISGYNSADNAILFTYETNSPSDVSNFMQNTFMIYELETPTTESADPFTDPQEIDAQGSEEFTDNRSVPIPVGHESYYANICEIEGIDEINLFHTGVNIFGGETLADVIVQKVPNAVKDEINKTVIYDGQYIRNIPLFNKFKANTQYTFFIKRASGASNLKINYTDGTQTLITTYPQISDVNKTVRNLSGEWITGTSVISYDECGLFEGVKTVDEYKAYTGESALVEIGQTVYGGYYDKDLGIVLTSKIIDLGSLNYTYYPNTLRFAAKIDDGNPSGTAFGLDSAMSELYPISTAQYNAIPDKSISVGSNYFSGSTCAVVIHDENYATVNDIKTLINGRMISYELADPIIIPAEKVNLTTVKGVNNVWSDTNGETEVKFFVKES